MNKLKATHAIYNNSMYNEHFGLEESPFSIAPNPQYLFMSALHREALAHLLYGIQGDGGFIMLTGEVGTGKTTLCRCLLQQIPSDVEVAFVLNPRVSAVELLATICDEFHIDYGESPSLKICTDELNTFLMKLHSEDRRAVLIIDEAQNLSQDVLEQIRLLTNLETNDRKLLQILLLGQPELLDTLADPKLRQFNQRITARYHLGALDKSEVRQYIAHRLRVAGGDDTIFRPSACNAIFKLSQGIPRLINLICDRALLGAYAAGQSTVSASTSKKAAQEVLGPARRSRSLVSLSAAAGIFVAAITAYQFSAKQSEGLVDPQTIASAAAETATQAPATSRMSAQATRTTVTGHTSIGHAYHDLVALWGTAFSERATNPCGRLNAIGLMCMSRQVELDELLLIDRPVIVQIDSHYLTLSELDEAKATLFAGDQQFELTRSEFSQRFNGRVSLIWRTPPNYSSALHVDDSGAAVDWLVMQLAVIKGNTPPLRTGFIYDEQLASEVRQFQTSVGLTPDGVVDAMTWIHINSVEAVNIPTLSQATASREAQG